MSELKNLDLCPPTQLSAEPNSWFGLNRQDYWSWIEPLQDYYFNEK